jgi:shikimate kinase
MVSAGTVNGHESSQNAEEQGAPGQKPSRLQIVRDDRNPDTLGVVLSRAVAGAAIEDHFLDVVVPTVENATEQLSVLVEARLGKELEALRAERQKILSEADETIDRAVESTLRNELKKMIQPALKRLVDQEMKKAVIASGGGLTIELLDPANERVQYLSRQHYMFPILLRLLCVRDRNGNPLNTAVVGPAGNGKTSMALGCAEALGIEAILQPFNPQTTKSDLLGYMAADGKYVPSPFYEAFTKGKIFIADEFDAANPSIAVTLNAAVANRTLTFPNLETVKAHPNFRAVFIMNTGGTGADHQYTGRMRQDAATLDRMVYLHVPIDKGLEAAIASVDRPSERVKIGEGGKFSSNEEILGVVQAVRKATEDTQMKYIISPRATLHATAMHAAGFGKRWIMECCVWRGMNETDRRIVSEKAGLKV